MSRRTDGVSTESVADEQNMEDIIAELATIDPHERFEMMKAQFFAHDTYLNEPSPEEINTALDKYETFNRSGT